MSFVLGRKDAKTGVITLETVFRPTEAAANTVAQSLASTTEDRVMIFQLVGEYQRKVSVERVGENANGNGLSHEEAQRLQARDSR